MTSAFYSQRKRFIIIVAMVVTGLSTAGCSRQPLPLQARLNAGPGDPVFTTYCAALERAEFALDEGYHFRYDDPERSPAFASDHSGEWRLEWIVNGNTVQKQSDYHRQPVITTSWPDMVRYHASIHEDLRIDAQLIVQSSHTALHDVSVENTGQTSHRIELLSSFHSGSDRAYSDVDYLDTHVRFVHRPCPDSWMVSHEQPFVSPVHNLFMMTEDGIPAYDQAGGWLRVSDTEPAAIAPQVHVGKDSKYVVWGRMTDADGNRIQLLENDLR
ncbi:hypothetical protein GF324_03560, partial [bacterium]|nr:hypothetical protein [bacterium]